MKQNISSHESGYALVCFALALVVVVGFCALVLDIGLRHEKNAERQIAADIAAYAGALILPDATTDDEVFDFMHAYATENKVPHAAISELSCGVWYADADTYSACGDDCDDCPCASCTDANVNAVRVAVDDVSQTYFARMFQADSLPVRVSSVALVQSDADEHCVRPFGIIHSLVPSVGQTFSILRASPGNWGKLNIDPSVGNMSGRPAFQHAMTTEECGINVQEGGVFSSESATGFAGMDQVFRNLIGTKMIIPLTTIFGNGHTTVQILEFAEVEIVSTSGNGSNWRGTFRVLRRSVSPRGSGSTSELPPRWVQ